MDVTAIDRSAIGRTTGLHGASARAKLAGLALVLLAVVASWNILVLAAVALTLVAVATAARLDMRLALGLAAYPALFAAVFAFASAPSWLGGGVIVLKATTAALAAVVLVLTTPYPQIFAPLQRVMPGLVGDALLMTYRTFFLLGDRFGSMLRAVRLRSGAPRGHTGALRTARMIGSALGSLVLYAIELAERDYDVLYVRGYTGRIRAASTGPSSPLTDALVVGFTLALAATAVLWRVGWYVLNPYSWLPLLAAVALLIVSIVWRFVRGSQA